MLQGFGDFLFSCGIPIEYTGYARMVVLGILSWGVALLCGSVCRRVLVPLTNKFTQKTSAIWDDYLLNEQVIVAFSRVVPPVVMYMLLPFVLYDETGDTALFQVSHFVTRLASAFVLAAFMRLLLVFVSHASLLIEQDERMQNHYIIVITQFVKLLIVIVGVIAIFSVMIDRSPLHFIAGLGAAATVLMLVFKDPLLGLVAGVQLSVNGMLRPGDWVTLPKHHVDGMVEQVTLTTVKIRGFDNTIYTIPPYTLISDTLQNWRGMFERGGRRVKRSFFIDSNTIRFCTIDEVSVLQKKYQIPDEVLPQEKLVNLTLYRKYLEHYLLNNKAVNTKFMCMVRQLQPTPEGLPIEFYFFFKETAFVNFERLQADMLEYFVAIMNDFGLRMYQKVSGWDLHSFSSKLNKE